MGESVTDHLQSLDLPDGHIWVAEGRLFSLLVAGVPVLRLAPSCSPNGDPPWNCYAYRQNVTGEVWEVVWKSLQQLEQGGCISLQSGAEG